MDWFGEWRDLATWWHAMTPNPAEFWYGAGVVVNLLLALVGAFAFKASRDAADAARLQAAISAEEARRLKEELDAKSAPHLAPYLDVQGDIFSLHVFNFGTGVVLLHQAKYEYRDSSIGEFVESNPHNGPDTLLHRTRISFIRPGQDESLYAIAAYPSMMDGFFEYKIAQSFTYSDRPEEAYTLHLLYTSSAETSTLRHVVMRAEPTASAPTLTPQSPE